MDDEVEILDKDGPISGDRVIMHKRDDTQRQFDDIKSIDSNVVPVGHHQSYLNVVQETTDTRQLEAT